ELPLVACLEGFPRKALLTLEFKGWSFETDGLELLELATGLCRHQGRGTLIQFGDVCDPLHGIPGFSVGLLDLRHDLLPARRHMVFEFVPRSRLDVLLAHVVEDRSDSAR